MSKSIKKLEEKCEELATAQYSHFSFEVSDDNGYLCISQTQSGKRKQKIVLQYAQIENLVDCINLIKKNNAECGKIKQEIDVLKKEK